MQYRKKTAVVEITRYRADLLHLLRHGSRVMIWKEGGDNFVTTQITMYPRYLQFKKLKLNTINYILNNYIEMYLFTLSLFPKWSIVKSIYMSIFLGFVPTNRTPKSKAIFTYSQTQPNFYPSLGREIFFLQYLHSLVLTIRSIIRIEGTQKKKWEILDTLGSFSYLQYFT